MRLLVFLLVVVLVPVGCATLRDANNNPNRYNRFPASELAKQLQK